MTLESDHNLLAELQPRVEQLLNRHLGQAKEWIPSFLVPWSRGEDYPDDYEWSPEEAKLTEVARSALFVNVLTEDNLPYYFRDIERMFGRDGAWGEWVRRWTAEEGRHGQVIHDYLAVTRAIDPVDLERSRMAQVQQGQVPEPPNALEGMAYVAIQELATRISHFNTGKHLSDPAGKAIMRRVAFDENLHFLFYRDALSAALEIDPSGAVIAIKKQVVNFAMPGVGIANFEEHARVIANAGIYDLAVHHEQILKPVLIRDLGLLEVPNLSGEAEKAREELAKYITRVERIGARIIERRAAREEREAERQ